MSTLVDGDDTALVDNRLAWQQQALAALPHDTPQPFPPRVELTQFPGHGPGAGLLAPLHGATVVELGCGPGDNLAAAAAAGAHCVGVDAAPAQIWRAEARWPETPMRLHTNDARQFLAATPTRFDLCLSIFGAVGLCPPHQLLPLIATRLAAGGRLVFSVPDPRWLGDQRDRMQLADGRDLRVHRWHLNRRQWHRALRRVGLYVTRAVTVPDPHTGRPCCRIVTARRPAV